MVICCEALAIVLVCLFSPHLILRGRKSTCDFWTSISFPFQITAMPSTHKKDKPWDTDDIDKWNVSLIESIS
jgi:hypothetical protein